QIPPALLKQAQTPLNIGIGPGPPPRKGDDYVRQGNLSYRQGDLDGALASYTKALEINPELADVYHARGVIYGSRNNYAAALADFTKAIEVENPKSAENHYFA